MVLTVLTFYTRTMRGLMTYYRYELYREFSSAYLDWRGEGLLHAMVEVPQAQLPADVCRHEQRRMLRRPAFDNHNNTNIMNDNINNSNNTSSINSSMNTDTNNSITSKTVAGGYTYGRIVDRRECKTTAQTEALRALTKCRTTAAL